MNYKGILISSDSVNIDNIVSLLMKRNASFRCINGFCSESIQSDFDKIISNKEIPIVLANHEIATEICEKFSDFFTQNLSFYIYNQEDQLWCATTPDSIKKKNEFFDMYNYCICAIDLIDIVTLVDKLWDIRRIGGGLPKHIITNMLKCGLLVRGGEIDNASNASYDLALGDEYYYAGKINDLTEKTPFLSIEPYDYVIASCRETIFMPKDVSGRFDISVNLFCQGIILSNSTQVDPGFRGKLFCLLFNTSNKVVYLRRGMHFTTIEFNKLIEPTTAYRGKYSDQKSIASYLPDNVMHGAINELKQEVENLKKESQRMQGLYISVVALFLTIISIALVLR